MADVRVGIVGAGRAGMVHAVNLHELAKDATVAAIVDSNAQPARGASSRLGDVPLFTSLTEAIEAGLLDAVVITTPTFTHRSLTVAAAKAGLHVFCEKPMALTLDECREMISTSEGAGVVLQIGFMRRFQPEFVEAKRRLENGDVGQPMIVKSLTRGPGLPPTWAWDIKSSNGMLAEVNSHDFDCVRWLAGSDIDRVYVEVANMKGRARGVDIEGFYDNAVVSLKFDSGAIGTIDGTCPADYGYDARAEVVGTEGLLIIGDLGGRAILEIKDRDSGVVTPVHRTWPDRFAEAYRAEMRSFIRCCPGHEQPRSSAEDGYQAVRAVLAGNRSWQEGRAIRLDEIADGDET